jgi:hypothetical protein
VTAYSPPTRSVLRANISRDLHDSNNKTFSTGEVNDLINLGIAELNQLQPVEFVEDVVLSAGVFSYALDASVEDLFRVELWRDGGLYRAVPIRESVSNDGWEFFAGSVRFPTGSWFDETQDLIRVWGYRVRDPLTADEDVAEIDLEGEGLIRSHAQFSAFQRMMINRSLFQQWQTSSNNADVSATQLVNMASLYASVWRDQRMRMKKLRRPG